MIRSTLIALSQFIIGLSAADLPAPPPIALDNAWPPGVGVVRILASDGERQLARWFSASSNNKRPLLVGLHTWSSTYDSAGSDAVYADWCIRQGWHFIHPNFRGFNNTPLPWVPTAPCRTS
ncbi:MAG: hypothetical protein EXS36_04740 [Pedosphaera sp.]|nr:hypothetical protein [Pedosphaera sp.]